MKKKILNLGIIAILVGMLFILVGCGNVNNKQNDKMLNEENVKNALLGTWSGKDSINRDSTWEFQNDKVIFSQYYDYIDKTLSWEGTYEIVDSNVVIINIENWDYEKRFNYEIIDNKYLNLINITEEQQYQDFPDFKNLEKKQEVVNE